MPQTISRPDVDFLSTSQVIMLYANKNGTKKMIVKTSFNEHNNIESYIYVYHDQTVVIITSSLDSAIDKYNNIEIPN